MESNLISNVLNFVYYDPASSTGLRWKENIYGGKGHKTIIKRMGTEAGSFSKRADGKSKCCSVHIGKKVYVNHQIIWYIFNGVIPSGMVIDHINGDPWDNRIENLSCKTWSGNSQNRNKNETNTSGFTGVRWRVVNGCTYTVAFWKESVGDRDKSFSVKRYGLLTAFMKACEYRLSQIDRLNSEGCNYTDRHNGVVMLHDAKNGFADPSFISTKFLIDRLKD